ncbi:hypothetical protein Tco_1289015, partial [Tanacetum coccineum]
MAALQYKDDHNRIAYLGRERGSEDFTDILSYLDHSPLRYALTHDPPVVFDSLVKQFWATATVRPNAAGSHDLVATIDGREVVVTESLIRAQLQLDDANGIFDMQIDDIFAGMGAIGYPPALRLEVGINFQVPLPQPLFVYRLAAQVSLDNACQMAEKSAGSLADKQCMGRIDSLETELGTTKKIMGGAILTLVSRVKKLEKTVKQLRTTRLVGDVPAAEGDVDIQDDVDLDGLSRMASAALGHDQPAVPSEDVEEREEEEVPLRRKRSAYRRARTEFSTPAFEQFQANLSAGGLPHTAVSESAGPSVAADKGKAPMPDLDIPAEFLAEDAQARKRFEEEQASERLVQRLQAEDLAQEVLPNVSEQRAKELDELMMRMTETDWLNLMMQVGSNPALARELLGADVTEENFIERMTAIKERKKRALADLRYRALKGKPLKQSEVTQMMRNLVKNQWCAAHNGTITMTAVKAMTKQQLLEEYEYICKRLEKDRLLSAQYNLFQPNPAITEPPSKRQRVERGPSQSASVPAATAHTADDPDSAGGGSSHPAGSVTPMAGSAAS